VLSFYAYVSAVTQTRDPLGALLHRLSVRFRFLTSAARLYEGVRLFHPSRRVLFETLALSVVIHLLGAWACLNLAFALGESALSVLSLLLVFPLGTLVNIVPLAPAGIGTGHAAFLYFFHLIGSERGADIYSLIALTTLLFGGVGGLVYLAFGADVRDLTPGLKENQAI
jgi:glycosyltransferase 2 family protein